MQRFRDVLHKVDPYEGFAAQDYPPDMQGWGSNHPVFQLLIEVVRPELIIEVGTWKGASAIHMGRLLDRAGLSTEIICVDTWLGSAGLYTRNNDKFFDSLGHRFGYPTLYYTFLANVVRAGQQPRITPLPLPSELAAQVLAHFGAKADLIYIDASHDYESVKLDLHRFWPLLTDDGVLFGDDYGLWLGVTKAVNEFSGTISKPLHTAAGKFVISNGRTGRFKSVLSAV
jgi:hypothetical protein